MVEAAGFNDLCEDPTADEPFDLLGSTLGRLGEVSVLLLLPLLPFTLYLIAVEDLCDVFGARFETNGPELLSEVWEEGLRFGGGGYCGG